MKIIHIIFDMYKNINAIGINGMYYNIAFNLMFCFRDAEIDIKKLLTQRCMCNVRS